MAVDLIIFPSSYFSLNEIDDGLEAEYRAVMKTGLFDVVLFSYDKWFNEGELVLNKQVSKIRTAVYRGWMMKPEIYSVFYARLLAHNIRLITSPEQYSAFHIFPNVYPLIEEDTAKTLIYPDGENIVLSDVKKQMSRFMVKDFVKSVKGTDFPAYFDEMVTEEEFSRWMKVFYEYRGDLYTGGLCIKEYLSLKRSDGKTNEYRVFYLNGEILSISRNSGQNWYATTPPKELLDKYKVLSSPYYTVDFAELDDGSWKIIEAGDGQVSGLSDGQDYNAYFSSLYYALN